MCNNMEKIKVFDIETVISWCADVVEEYETIKKEGYSFEDSEESKRKEEYMKCCEDLLEECIFLNEDVAFDVLMDKNNKNISKNSKKSKKSGIKIRKLEDVNGCGPWVVEWEENMKKIREGRSGKYVFGSSGEEVLEWMSKSKCWWLY